MPKFVIGCLALSMLFLSCVTPSNSISPNASTADVQLFQNWYTSLLHKPAAAEINSENIDRYLSKGEDSRPKKVVGDEYQFTRTLLEDGKNPDLLLLSSKGSQEYERDSLHSRTQGWKRRFPKSIEPFYETPGIIVICYGNHGFGFKALYIQYLVIDKKSGNTIDEIRFYKDFPSVAAAIGDRLYLYHQQSKSLYVLSLRINQEVNHDRLTTRSTRTQP